MIMTKHGAACVSVRILIDFDEIYRTKQIEGHDGATLVSEGIDANYMDMINYSVFGLIKLEIWRVNSLHSIIGIWTNACRFLLAVVFIFSGFV